MKTPRDGCQLDEAGLETVETIDVLVTKVLRETGKALFVVIDGRCYWLPKSQITNPERVGRSHWNDVIEVSAWWVREANVIGYA